jgi:hypothetical protein
MSASARDKATGGVRRRVSPTSVPVSTLHVFANRPTVALCEQREFYSVGMGRLGFHPFSNHLSLGVNDLGGTRKLELKPYSPAGSLRFEQPSESHTVRADVAGARRIWDAAHVLVEEDVESRSARPALFVHVAKR